MDISSNRPHPSFFLVIDIFIKSIIKKIPFDEIRYYFFQLDSYFMDEQIILNMLKYLPSEKELKKLTEYQYALSEDIEKLGIPEKFCLQMMETKRLKERLESMLFKSTFWERYTVLHKVNPYFFFAQRHRFYILTIFFISK